MVLSHILLMVAQTNSITSTKQANRLKFIIIQVFCKYKGIIGNNECISRFFGIFYIILYNQQFVIKLFVIRILCRLISGYINEFFNQFIFYSSVRLNPRQLKKSVNQIRIEYQRLKSLHRKWYAILFHHYLSGIDGRE